MVSVELMMIVSMLALLWNSNPSETLFSVDLSVQKPISPYIYGNNVPDWATQGKLFTLARQGGNRMTAYNWETNASNAGNDYHHQNDGYMGATDEPGWTVRTFMEPAQAHGAAVLVTVPTAGYVSADKKGDGDVNKTPNYLETRFHKSLPKKGSKFIYPPDTKDRFVYQDEFVAWLEKIKSPSTPVWYSLDNEPDLWGSTHARIWQKNPTIAQIVENNVAFATAIKDVAPKSQIFGPANYGWNGFRTFQNAPDGNGRDFLDVYLSALRDAEKRAGKRLLDVLDVHWYPEAKGGGKRIAFEGGDAAVEAARIQAPRSLWDPTYVEDSWIADSIGKKPIVLLPKLMEQIRANYPGTKLGITEYNYGGAKLPGGFIAQADVLGIFGREGLFAASAFIIGKDDIAQNSAFAAFRDFDGAGAKFGDLGVRVTGAEPSSWSAYAALDTKDRSRLTVIVINKRSATSPVRINLDQFRGKSVRGFTIKGSDFKRVSVSGLTMNSGIVSFESPGLSVTTLELKK